MDVRLWMEHKEGWVLKNWCFQTVMLEETLESPLDCKEIKQVSPKGNQPWIFIGRTDAEAPILWPPEAKSQRMGKDPDAGKEWGQEEKRMTEDEMVGWHRRVNGHGFEQTLGDGEGQGNLACWSQRVWHDGATEQQQAESLQGTQCYDGVQSASDLTQGARLLLQHWRLRIRPSRPCQESLWLSVFPLSVVLGWLGYTNSCVPNKGTLESTPTKHAQPSETHTPRL